MFITVTTTYLTSDVAYFAFLIDLLSVLLCMLIERGLYFYCIYETEYSLFSVSLPLITAKVYTKQRPSMVLSTTKIFIGGRGDGSGRGHSIRGLGKGKSCL